MYARREKMQNFPSFRRLKNKIGAEQKADTRLVSSRLVSRHIARIRAQCTQRETRDTHGDPAWPFDVRDRTLTPRDVTRLERTVFPFHLATIPLLCTCVSTNLPF